MDEEAEKIINMLNNLPADERERVLASLVGMTVEEQAENTRRHELAQKYVNEQLPYFEIEWDLSQESRRFAFDGYDEEAYRKYYPDGLIIGWVDFQEFCSKLAAYSRRTKEELWTRGFITKIAIIILDFVEGRAMTPPHVCLDEDGVSIAIRGGNHRIAVCLAKEVERIPILVLPTEKMAIEVVLPSIKWADE